MRRREDGQEGRRAGGRKEMESRKRRSGQTVTRRRCDHNEEERYYIPSFVAADLDEGLLVGISQRRLLETFFGQVLAPASRHLAQPVLVATSVLINCWVPRKKTDSED